MRLETDRHETGFSEASLLYRRGAATWLAGGALSVDRYRSRSVPSMNYGFTVPAIFAQLEVDPAPALALSVSARIDDHSRYGTFLSPRGSLLLRPASAWNIRLSAGTGFFAPTPFVDQTEQSGLSLLRPWNTLRAEEAVGGSVDIGAVFGGLELNVSAFGSSIQHAVQLREYPGALAPIELINATGKTTAKGIDVLAKRRSGPLTVTSSYTFTSTEEPDPEGPGTRPVPLTPRHAASLVASWEKEDVGRVGVELYYTGRQGLDHDPYRATSRPFAVVGLLVERVFGRVRVFVNGENLTNRRQSLVSPLLRPTRTADGRWTTDAWGSLEGRVVNAGLRLSLGSVPE
jgi:iron complex outermembrane receptor protein